MVKIARKKQETMDKRAADNERRLASVSVKRDAIRARKDAVSAALRAADAPNKRIRFDSSSSDGADTADADASSAAAPLPSSWALFDDDGGDDAEEGGLFASRPEHGGAKGARLMQLESRFDGDRRFRMDHRFLDDLSDHEADAATSKLPEELKGEKQTQLSVLEKVLGKNLTDKNSPRAAAGRKFVRYDPRNPAHHRYNLTLADSVKSDVPLVAPSEHASADANGEQAVDEESVPKSDKKRYFEMDASFAETLKLRAQAASPDEASFSLLASLPNRQPAEQKPLKKAKVPAAVQTPMAQSKVLEDDLPKWKQDLLNTRARAASASSDEAESDAEDKSAAPLAAKPATTAASATSNKPKLAFFLAADDKRLKRAVEKFRRTDDMEKVRKNWERFRPSLVKCYKRLRKEAVKKQKFGATAPRQQAARTSGNWSRKPAASS